MLEGSKGELGEEATSKGADGVNGGDFERHGDISISDSISRMQRPEGNSSFDGRINLRVKPEKMEQRRERRERR